MDENRIELIVELDKFSVLRKMCISKICTNFGLYFNQPSVIKYISHHEGCTQKDLAEFLNVTPASIALSTKRLQKAGYIQKKPDEKNLRCNSLYTTNLGKEISQKCIDKFDELNKNLLAGFSDEEIDSFLSCLQKINQKIAENGKSDPYISTFFNLMEEEKSIQKEGIKND